MPPFLRHRHTWPLLICCCLGAAAAATAQTGSASTPPQSQPGPAQPAAPAPPFVNAPAPGSQWSVEVKPGAHASGAAPHRLVMQLGQNRIAQGTVESANGQKTVYYTDGDNIIAQEGGKAVNMHPDDAPPLINEDGLVVRLYPGVWWLSSKFYAGTELLGNTPCYKFVNDRQGRAPLTAWIRVADRFPARVQIGETAFTFSGPAPFSKAVELPENVAKKLAKMKVQINALKRIVEENKN